MWAICEHFQDYVHHAPHFVIYTHSNHLYQNRQGKKNKGNWRQTPLASPQGWVVRTIMLSQKTSEEPASEENNQRPCVHPAPHREKDPLRWAKCSRNGSWGFASQYVFSLQKTMVTLDFATASSYKYELLLDFQSLTAHQKSLIAINSRWRDCGTCCDPAWP